MQSSKHGKSEFPFYRKRMRKQKHSKVIDFMTPRVRDNLIAISQEKYKKNKIFPRFVLLKMSRMKKQFKQSPIHGIH